MAVDFQRRARKAAKARKRKQRDAANLLERQRMLRRLWREPARQSLAASIRGTYWVLEGTGLAERPSVRNPPPTTPSSAAGRWVAAQDLQCGDRVAGTQGKSLVVTALNCGPYRIPCLQSPADCELFWVIEGPGLETRPAVKNPPRSQPAGADTGRWVVRRELRIGDLFQVDERTAYAVTALPADPDEPPQVQLRQLCRVEKTFANGRKPLLRVHYANEMIRVTPNHPWYVKDKGWTPSAALLPGDLLQTHAGGFVPVERVEDLGEVDEVFNLCIADCHTYFVSGKSGGPAVLVHNQSPRVRAKLGIRVAEAEFGELRMRSFEDENGRFGVEITKGNNRLRIYGLNEEQALEMIGLATTMYSVLAKINHLESNGIDGASELRKFYGELAYLFSNVRNYNRVHIEARQTDRIHSSFHEGYGASNLMLGLSMLEPMRQTKGLTTTTSPLDIFAVGATALMQAGIKAAVSAIVQETASEATGGLFDVAQLARGVLKQADEILEAVGKCFPADTPVHTSVGSKPIQEVTTNDSVWGFDFVAGTWALYPVTATFEFGYSGTMVTLKVDGESISSTARHPFWVVNGEALADRPRMKHHVDRPEGCILEGRWVDAVDLLIGDVLYLRGDQCVAVTSIDLADLSTTVYNLQVEQVHCYAVGDVEVLVHNNCGDFFDVKDVKLIERVAAGNNHDVHHLMTDKNNISKAAGGPYTPKFEALAEKRGITLQDAMNKVQLPGHQGPHPEYNKAVYEYLSGATKDVSGSKFNITFDKALDWVRTQTVKPGTRLNKLATGKG